MPAPSLPRAKPARLPCDRRPPPTAAPRRRSPSPPVAVCHPTTPPLVVPWSRHCGLTERHAGTLVAPWPYVGVAPLRLPPVLVAPRSWPGLLEAALRCVALLLGEVSVPSSSTTRRSWRHQQATLWTCSTYCQATGITRDHVSAPSLTHHRW